MRESWRVRRSQPYLSLPKAFDAEILDHRVRKQFAAHVFDVGIAGALGQIELDQLAGADIVDPAKPEALQRMMDGFALRIEDPGLQGDEHARFHCFACQVASAGSPMAARHSGRKLYHLFTLWAHFAITGRASPAL